MLREQMKNVLMVTAPVCMSAAAVVTSYASEDPGGGSSVTDAVASSLVTSVSEIATSIGGVIGQVIPVALPLIGAGLVVTIGIKVFKKVSHQA